MDREHNTLNEYINLVCLDNMTVTQRITRKLEVKLWQRGCHRESLIMIKMMGFRKKCELTPDEEGSFSVNKRTNNEAYKLEHLEDIERSKT